MPWASFSMLDGPGGTAHGIEKLLLKTQVSLTSFLQSEVKIIHIIVQNNTYYSARSRWTKTTTFMILARVWSLIIFVGKSLLKPNTTTKLVTSISHGL